jgi:SAM-dependent methyltransferase
MDNPRPTSRSWKLVPFFDDTIADAREILNLGSGDGYLSWYLEQRPGDGACLRITDLDVADHSTTGRRPQIFDGETLPFADRSFDVTLCMYVLHHTPSPDRLIAEIGRVTRRYVIVAEDLAETPLDRALCLYHAIRFDRWNTRSGRFGFRTHDGWAQAFAAAGLELRRSKRLPRFSHLTSKTYPVRRALMIFAAEGQR